MTHVLVALFCTALGYFAGVAMVTAALRDDVRALDAAREELERRIKSADYARTERRVEIPLADAKRILGATLLNAHVELVTGKGWRS
jgi:CYTH domain-containing protein